MTYMQRSRWIRGDGLEQDALTAADLGSTVVVAILENSAKLLLVRCGGEGKVNKSWSRDFDFLDKFGFG